MSKIQNETNSQRIAFSGKFGNSDTIDHLNPNLINIINRGLQDVKRLFFLVVNATKFSTQDPTTSASGCKIIALLCMLYKMETTCFANFTSSVSLKW